MSDNIAISVKGVSKDFKLPHERADSVKSLFINPFNKDRKKIEIQHALKDISFDIPKGEFFGIVGRNGSGKSTLLKIIAGIYQPNKGTVKINGRLVPFIELGVGFNPQLTGRENVYLNGALLGFSEKEVDAKYGAIVDFAELSNFMDQKLKNYSSGMQVRLAFSVATILAESDVLLIDEVLAVGDADFQRKCFKYFKKLKKDKKTVVFVSHDMSAVREYCDRVILIDKGYVAQLGEPEAVAKKYTQLFAEESQSGISNPKAKRWGNKHALFEGGEARVVDSGANILLSAKVICKKPIADPVYGFTISNEAGQSVMGTNSHIVKVKAAPLEKDEIRTIHWKFPNIFNEGRFEVELVLMYQSITVVADWWEGAVFFSITNEEKTPYIVNPPTTFTEERIDG